MTKRPKHPKSPEAQPSQDPQGQDTAIPDTATPDTATPDTATPDTASASNKVERSYRLTQPYRFSPNSTLWPAGTVFVMTQQEASSRSIPCEPIDE